MKIIFSTFILLSAMIFFGCQSAASSSAAQSGIKQVSVTETKKAVETKDVQFIDVRTVEEYKGGHAPKTVNLPLDKLENELSKLDKNKPVYVICQTGRRSQKGAEILEKAGFKEIYNVSGGTGEWISTGLPTEN